MTQIAPLKEGTWRVSEYFSPHNEHRVLFTRLISMALMELNGGIWSNLVEAYANTVIYSVTMALFYVLACRGATRSFALLMLLAVVILGIMPYDWENTLVGFQNQFYVMIAFAIALVGIASYGRPNLATAGLLAVVAFVGLFTMASGLFAAAAVCAVVVLRTWRAPLPKIYVACVVAAMILVVLCGFLLLPDTPGNGDYKAQGLIDHIHAFALALVWPLVPVRPRHFLLATMIWAPSLIWLIKFLITRTTRDRDIFLMGIIAWVLLQAVAIAHARGHNITSIPSRYSNICALGLLANLGLALSLVFDEQLGAHRRTLGQVAIALGAGVIAFVFIKRFPDDMDVVHQRYDFSRMETFYTRSYLRSKNPAFLQHPSLTIPFPNAELLKTFLDTPVVQSLLPPSLQPDRASVPDVSANQKSFADTALDIQKSVQHFMAGLGVSTPSIFFKEEDGDLSTGDSPIGACSNTDVNETEVSTAPFVAKSNDPMRFYGWVINPQSRITGRFFIVLSGPKTYRLEVNPFMKRPDVVKVMHSKPRDTFGYRAYGILLGVPPGDYAVQLTTAANPAQLICKLPFQLVITS
ncbi:hypothetical protein [Dyella sp. C11]|uniref:hypothetical protein n=1 Tax=Dyella sp. C11 TaxID=2126991 RepID=UPI0013005A18|nr:hypothetical protein [Dyella sp. C11]